MPLSFLVIPSDTITGLWLLHLFSVCRPFRKHCPRFDLCALYLKDLITQKCIRRIQSHITHDCCDLCGMQEAEDTWVKQKMPKKTNRWWFWRKNSVQQVFIYFCVNSTLLFIYFFNIWLIFCSQSPKNRQAIHSLETCTIILTALICSKHSLTHI